MQKRLTLLLLLALLTACAPRAPQASPTAAFEAPKLPPPKLDSSVDKSSKLAMPTYEASVPAILWDTKTRVYQLLPVEPSNGEPVPGYEPIVLGINYYYAISPDGRTLVIVGYPSDSLRNPVLHKIDLTSWRETTIPLVVTGWVGGLTFSPDGQVGS